ncbi:MAG: ATP-binding cassette domain-containing protein [Bacteroidales bacterium]
MNVIETDKLSFSYGKQQVLNKIDLKIPKNSIYGLLGRNGAGKSTILKLLLGLLRTKEGNIRYWGSAEYDHTLFYRIGNMIESPALYHFLTVEEHLKMLDILFKKGNSRVDEVLELVGLSGEKRKKAARLSTGLKQRLALALALFRDPDILILDEPINGLDPVGIIDVRELLLKLQQQEKTVLLSSHIISEVEKLCTHVGIIEQGELKYQGALTDVPGESLEDFYISLIKTK